MYSTYTLDALWTLQERMERNGTNAGPKWTELLAELARRMSPTSEEN